MELSALWKSFDQYTEDRLFDSDPIMEDVLKENAAAGLPAINVSPQEGKFLQLLVKLTGAKNILEIGTLGGYSTIWLARALPKNGTLLSLEYSSKHAKTAEKNIQKSGLSDQVDILVGSALDSFENLTSLGYGTFDFVFIDADKKNNKNYMEAVLEHSRPGTCIVVDNVVRDGKVLEENTKDPELKGIQEMFDWLSDHPRFDSTAIQTVGSKGYDGFLLAIVQ